MSKVTNAPKWQRRKEDRPSEILDAALDVFSEKGFSATRMEDVAARAGISKGTLYLYFEDKEDIFRKGIESAMLPGIEAFEQVARDENQLARARLEAVFGHAAVMMSTTRAGLIPRMIIAEAGNFPNLAKYYFENVVRRVQGLVMELLQSGIARGEFRPTDVEYASRILAAPMLMLALAKSIPVFHEGWNIDAGRHAQIAVDVMLSGLIAEKDEVER